MIFKVYDYGVKQTNKVKKHIKETEFSENVLGGGVKSAMKVMKSERFGP